MSSEFLAYYLRTRFFQSLLWESTSFSAQPGIYLTDLGRFPIILPPLDEQAEIVKQMQTIFAPIERAQSMVSASIDHLREFHSALITAAVTGQIDVATWGKRGTTDRRLDAIEADIAATAQPERQQARA
jgi:type I restriction enzyme S subunit